MQNLVTKVAVNGGNFPKLRWSPSDEHKIRIIPYGKNPLKDSILEVSFHYDLGETKSLLCLESNDLVLDKNGQHKSAPGLTYEKKCEVDEYAKDLYSKFNEHGSLKSKDQKEADYHVFKKVKPTVRFAALIVERGKEAEGPMWWCFSQNQLEQIIKICDTGPLKKMCGLPKDRDSGYAVVVDEDNAFDLKLSVKKAKNADGKGNGANYNLIEISISGDEPTALSITGIKKDNEKIISSVRSFTDAYPVKTTEEVSKILESFVKFEFSSKEPDVETQGVEYATNSNERVENVGSRLAEEAVNDLLNS